MNFKLILALCTLSGINASENSNIMNSNAVNGNIVNNQITNSFNFIDEDKIMDLPEPMQQVNATLPQPEIESVNIDNNEFIEECNMSLKEISNSIRSTLEFDNLLTSMLNVIADHFKRKDYYNESAQLLKLTGCHDLDDLIERTDALSFRRNNFENCKKLILKANEISLYFKKIIKEVVNQGNLKDMVQYYEDLCDQYNRVEESATNLQKYLEKFKYKGNIDDILTQIMQDMSNQMLGIFELQQLFPGQFDLINKDSATLKVEEEKSKKIINKMKEHAYSFDKYKQMVNNEVEKMKNIGSNIIAGKNKKVVNKWKDKLSKYDNLSNQYDTISKQFRASINNFEKEVQAHFDIHNLYKEYSDINDINIYQQVKRKAVIRSCSEIIFAKDPIKSKALKIAWDDCSKIQSDDNFIASLNKLLKLLK